MHLSLIGRQIDVSDAFRVHVEESLASMLSKYFGDAIEATVTLSREAHLYRCVISAHIGRGIQLEARADADEIYPAFDMAADRLAKRLRRYKRRLRDHHREAEAVQSVAAQQYILAGTDRGGAEDEEAEAGEPAVVAEMTTEVPHLTVSEAVMRMDLADLPALMFRNSAHGGLNMIYRRADGNIGWIDPRGNTVNAEQAI
jgi:ribosomal subunit interface protein